MAHLQWLFLFFLIVMPFDGVEHTSAQHDDFEREEDDREPIPHFAYFQSVLTRTGVSEHYAKTVSYNIRHLDADEAFHTHPV